VIFVGDVESIVWGSPGSTFSEVVEFPGRGIVKQALLRLDEGKVFLNLEVSLDVVEFVEQAGQQLGQHTGFVETWRHGL
jgi:hypothetical protein